MPLALRQINLKNFRVFRNLEFPIAPLTILTGPNSSGKSSIIKALLLLEDSLEKYGLGQLDFTNDIHRLGSYKTALNRYTDETNLDFDLHFSIVNEDSKSPLYAFDEDTISIQCSYLPQPNAQMGILTDLTVKTLDGNNDNGNVIFKLNKNEDRYNLIINLKRVVENIEKAKKLSLKPTMHLVRDKISSETFEHNFLYLKNDYQQDYDSKLLELEQLYSEQLQTDTQLASLNNELILLKKEVEQETKTLQIEYQKTIDALNFEFEEKIKNENDEDGINELIKEKETKIDETARNLNTELNKLQEKIDFVSVEIEKRKNEILDERDSKKKELQENFNKIIESLIPGTYHSLIYNAIIDKGRELIDSLENFEESFSTHKHKDLIALLNGNDWESQLQATLSYIQDTTLRDVKINTPELKFLGQSDRLLTLTIGELLDGGPNNPNQIVQTLIAEIRALILALQFRDATKYNEITFPFEFIHGIRGQQKRFYHLKSEYNLDKTIGWLLEMQNKATGNEAGKSSKVNRKRANDEKASKETVFIEDKINFIHIWLNKFGFIEEGGKIEAVQVDGAYVDINLYRTKEDFEKLKATSIADLGLGISQLLPIIITTAYYLDKNYLIAIEEPESHLHPKLQSSLADFIVDAINYGVRFLVETHSVYLIRKLEVLLASKQLPTENLRVCYIKRNDETCSNDVQIIDLKVTEYGLDQAEAQKLWYDFYDEAERLKVEKNRLSEHNKGKVIVFCENLNADILNGLNLPNLYFAKAKDKGDVAIHVRKYEDYYGLIDRDYLHDKEIELIKNIHNYRLFILQFYNFENYLFHPVNVKETAAKKNIPFDEESYKIKIFERHSEDRYDLVVNKIKHTRQSYFVLKEFTEEKTKPNNIEIAKAVMSDDFNTFYPFVNMKNYRTCKPPNLNDADLATTDWFKARMEEMFASIISKN